MYKLLYRIGIVAFVGLFILSIIFYKERIILLDEAFYLFNIVKAGAFKIEHFRYIAVVTEIFPLIARKLSLSLDATIMSYSIGFIVYYFICYLISGIVLKSHRFAIILLLYLVLFSTHTFYWMLSELIQGVAMLTVFFAYVTSHYYQSRKALNAIVFFVLIPTIAFAHPLMLFPFSFCLLFLHLDDKGTYNVRAVSIPMAIFIATILVKTLFFKEPYDAQSMEGIKNFKELFPNYINIHSTRVFVKNCLLKYQWIPILLITIASVYASSRQWTKLGLFLAYACGYALLICVSYPTQYTQDFYIENLFLPIGIFLAVPLVYDVLPMIETRKLAVPLISLILLTGFIRITLSHKFYTNRLNWLRTYSKQHANEKLMVDWKHLPQDTLLMPWASPYEFWLLSTAEQNKSASILFTDHMNEVAWAAPETKSFATAWGVFPYNTLDTGYFKFSDTITAYKVIQ